MMQAVGQHILSIVLAALICSIAVSLVPSDWGKERIRLIGGLLLSVVLLGAITSVEMPDLQFAKMLDPSAGTDISASGEKLAWKAMADIISEEAQTYILDKAKELGAAISAEVFVSEDAIPVPVSVILKGKISPYIRLRLDAVIQTELGIAKEYIRWME